MRAFRTTSNPRWEGLAPQTSLEIFLGQLWMNCFLPDRPKVSTTQHKAKIASTEATILGTQQLHCSTRPLRCRTPAPPLFTGCCALFGNCDDADYDDAPMMNRFLPDRPKVSTMQHKASTEATILGTQQLHCSPYDAGHPPLLLAAAFYLEIVMMQTRLFIMIIDDAPITAP